MMSRTSIFAAALLAVFASACSHAPVPAPVDLLHLSQDDRRLLAGVWEYEDGAVVTLTLDEQGHGAYAWKEGRFETTALSGRTWQGRWLQKENDREGGFLVELSTDYSEGDGRWWYTRIGSDRAPADKGGTFHLSRKATVTTLRENLPAP